MEHFSGDTFADGAFADIMSGNAAYAATFGQGDLPARAGQELAIVTCMDSRIDPLAITGLQVGDAKVIRNAGAQVTDEVLQTLVLAVYLLGVKRVLVVPHTNCKMASATEAEVHDLLTEAAGMDTRSLQISTIDDQQQALARDLVKIRNYPYLPEDLKVAGAIYDVATGQLQPFED